LAGLTFAGVRKEYGEVQALRGLDLAVRDGEFMVLVGPSGCGKTTALRAAAGLEDVTGGLIHIGDRDVTVVAPSERNVSMVFQSYALFPHLSVEENIGFGLAVRKVPRREARNRVRAAADLVGCGALLDRKPHQLSGGERQRVALARALVREPDVYLLDEPLSNLDAQLRVNMRAELRLLHQRVGATMVYVTHDQIEALTMGDRVAVLREGVIQQVGPPDEIYRRPVNRFVAGFVGSPAMNFLPAHADGTRMTAGPFVLPLPRAGLPSNGSTLEVGIRPEHLAVSAEAPGVPAMVELVEVAGSETFLHLRTPEAGMVARVGATVRPRVGSEVWLSAPPELVYVFDRTTGATLSGPA
jgi:multiple sugar transport system ATP-binding protein